MSLKTTLIVRDLLKLVEAFNKRLSDRDINVRLKVFRRDSSNPINKDEPFITIEEIQALAVEIASETTFG